MIFLQILCLAHGWTDWCHDGSPGGWWADEGDCAVWFNLYPRE